MLNNIKTIYQRQKLHATGTYSTKSFLLPIEWVTLGYTLFTTLLILIFWNQMQQPLRLILGRSIIVFAMCITMLIYYLSPNYATRFLRNLLPLSLLGYWYPDTYEFSQLFPNLDWAFAHMEAAIFHTQPSIVFSQLLPQKIYSELFHLGYFSYYPMIAATIILPLFYNKKIFERTAFIVLSSFFLYYLIYLFLPVTGPQYYFHAITMSDLQNGIYPHLEYYFRTHTQLNAGIGPNGFFKNLVEYTQASGERPTAAFPSSHVGMSTILMILLYKNNRKTAYCFMPLYLLLIASTVYIQAHYLIDACGGFVTAILFFFFTQYVYDKIYETENKNTFK